MAITIDETGIKIDGVLKVDINTAVQLANKANINGDADQTFKVADAINNDEAINKEQLLTEIGNIDLSIKADLNGNSSQTFKVADAVNNDEAINKGQLLAEINDIDGAGSKIDADLVRGLPADFKSYKNTNGYQKLPSGLILQWVKTPSTVEDDDTVAFPIAFPNDVFVVVHTGNTKGSYMYSVYDIDVTSCKVSKRDRNGGSINRVSSIIAIGY